MKDPDRPPTRQKRAQGGLQGSRSAMQGACAALEKGPWWKTRHPAHGLYPEAATCGYTRGRDRQVAQAPGQAGFRKEKSRKIRQKTTADSYHDSGRILSHR